MSVRLDHGEDTLAEVHEINVTPFIDVMLVLLIIFMVAAPLATVDIQVNLPASTAEPQPRPDKPLYLTIKSDLTLALGNDPVGRDVLRGTLDRGRERRQGRAHLPARRQGGAVRRGDGGDEHPARRGLPQGRAGRAGEGVRTMMALATEDSRTCAAGLISGAIVVLAHGALRGRDGHLARYRSRRPSRPPPS